ncbi:hypothetical protein GUJ93_ZPchr0013g34991 [Zizania palustris]|uniref:Yippee domain-containing protein n=1 Tax=Zizania palustris TaxID=103762 RepID=A0A8J5X815_ZIZPA|nr:hypothetical protein GUJ93_ZPchr0013g34991 [Zizania palustris]
MVDWIVGEIGFVGVMGLLFVESLPGPKVFKCKFCNVDSASPDAVVSKEFRGRYGRAYLLDINSEYKTRNRDRHMRRTASSQQRYQRIGSQVLRLVFADRMNL